MSMVWLAVFSYCMCATADKIHKNFGLTEDLLGITLCALGTSFPNFYASVLIARENRSEMAIANALGSNIQNVLLALGFPWACATVAFGEYEISSAGIEIGIVWMAGTLALVLYLAVSNNFQLRSEHGVVMILTYCIYLVFTILTT